MVSEASGSDPQTRLTLGRLRSLCAGVASDIEMLAVLDAEDEAAKSRLRNDIKSKMDTIVDGWLAFRSSAG